MHCGLFRILIKHCFLNKLFLSCTDELILFSRLRCYYHRLLCLASRSVAEAMAQVTEAATRPRAALALGACALASASAHGGARHSHALVQLVPYLRDSYRFYTSSLCPIFLATKCTKKTQRAQSEPS
jgi:hypothetical protein